MKSIKIILCLVFFLLISQSFIFALNLKINTQSLPVAPVVELAGNAVDIDTLLSEDFDSTAKDSLPPGWQTVDLTAIQDPPYWQIHQFHGYQDTYSWWCGVYAKAFSWGSYSTPPGYGNCWLQYLDLDVDFTGITENISMLFWHSYDMEYYEPMPPYTAWDGGVMRISTDAGSTWNVLTPDGGYPETSIYAFALLEGKTSPGYSGISGGGGYPEWVKTRVDLSSYKGKNVLIRFAVASDFFSSDEDGMYDSFGPWQLDNLLIKKASGDTIFYDNMDEGEKPEWTVSAPPPLITGDHWTIVDSTLTQNDTMQVFFTPPHSIFCGDSVSPSTDGTYRPKWYNYKPLDNVLVTPSIDLTNYINTKLSFRHRVKVYFDGINLWGGICILEATADSGETWDPVLSNYFPSKTSWHKETINIASICDRKIVQLRFRCMTGTGDVDYAYWYLDDILLTGEYSLGVDNSPETPPGDGLKINAYPNPFNPAATIQILIPPDPATFDIPVQIKIYDPQGGLVIPLLDKKLPAGSYSVVWDGRNQSRAPVSSGVYLCRIQAGDKGEAKKLVLLK